MVTLLLGLCMGVLFGLLLAAILIWFGIREYPFGVLRGMIWGMRNATGARFLLPVAAWNALSGEWERLTVEDLIDLLTTLAEQIDRERLGQ